MRKITLLLSLLVCILFVQAQTNLLVNPSFESWTDGAPDGWTTSTANKGTTTAETTIINAGSSSLKLVTTDTYKMYQSVPVTPGKTYTLSMSYYIEDGDGTDARIWSNFENEGSNVNTTELRDILQGPDGGYFANEKDTWKTYSIEVVAPANSTDFNFEFRTYTAATVYWDNFFFGEVTTGLNNTNASKFKATVIGKELLINNANNGSTVEIFSALGNKVQSSILDNGKIKLNNLSKGMYVVRVGRNTQKIML